MLRVEKRADSKRDFCILVISSFDFLFEVLKERLSLRCTASFASRKVLGNQKHILSLQVVLLREGAGYLLEVIVAELYQNT